MNQSLDLVMITNHSLLASRRTKALNRQHHTGEFEIPSPQILSSILVGSTVHGLLEARSMVHGPLEAQSTMDHPATQTRGC
jgi:hypothetical protein